MWESREVEFWNQQEILKGIAFSELQLRVF